jgi:hypothetical protein
VAGHPGCLSGPELFTGRDPASNLRMSLAGTPEFMAARRRDWRFPRPGAIPLARERPGEAPANTASGILLVEYC